MKKSLFVFAAALALVVMAGGAALAAEGEGGAGVTNWVLVASYLGAGLGISLAAVGGALAQSKAINAGLKGIARNPGAAGKLTTTLIIGLAMIESLVIYALVISLILVFKS